MYSDTDILAAVEYGDITISDFDGREKGPLGTNSYDVRLGKLFLEVIWGEDGPWYAGPIVADEGQRVAVPIGGTLLAMTKERIGMKGKITAIMKARSSTGKEALTICKCAGLGDVGYDNHWTMELSAFSRVGQPFVVVGQKIAQMAFFETKSEPKRPYNGQYTIDDWPLCMVPKKWRHRIIARVEDMPGFKTDYAGGKISKFP